MRTRLDAIRTIEACYAPEPNRERWLTEIVRTMVALDKGRGMYAKVYDLSDPRHGELEIVSAEGPMPAWRTTSREIQRIVGHTKFRQLHWPHPPVSLASNRIRKLAAPVAAWLADFYRTRIGSDLLGTLCGDHDGCGVLIGIYVPFGYSPPPRTVHILSRISAHLTSALRMRAMTDGRPPLPTDALTEAVLDPSGHVRDASGVAESAATRRHLIEAVRRLETARGPARKYAPEEAVELWCGLVDGRWSLVDHFENDGRRFVLARCNDAGVHDPTNVSPVERKILAFTAMGHSNKYVAYLLGLSSSTVATHLANLQHKLGIGSRRELIATFGSRTCGRGASDVGAGQEALLDPPRRYSSSPSSASSSSLPAEASPARRKRPASSKTRRRRYSI